LVSFFERSGQLPRVLSRRGYPPRSQAASSTTPHRHATPSSRTPPWLLVSDTLLHGSSSTLLQGTAAALRHGAARAFNDDGKHPHPHRGEAPIWIRQRQTRIWADSRPRWSDLDLQRRLTTPPPSLRGRWQPPFSTPGSRPGGLGSGLRIFLFSKFDFGCRSATTDIKNRLFSYQRNGIS
jgi:hypothetical protein